LSDALCRITFNTASRIEPPKGARHVRRRRSDRKHRSSSSGRAVGWLAGFVEKGAEAAVGDVSDAEFVAAACDGVGGVYCMIPPLYEVDLRAWQTEAGTALVSGIREAGVPYVVNLSSVGAQHHEGTGPIAGLREQEDRFNELSVANVLHLRPGWFMENFFMSLDVIRGMGVLGMPIRGLAALDFDGHHTTELLGPRDYTLTEVASIIGQAIGKPDLPFVRVPDEVAAAGLAEMGAHPTTVATFMEMYRGLDDGRIVPEETRSSGNTTPTTFEEFAQGLAAVYAG